MNKDQENLEEQTSRLDKIVEVLKEQKEKDDAALATAELQNKLTMVQSGAAEKLSADQSEAIESLVQALSGNKLQELETQKENNKRAEETLDLLGDIAKNTEPGAGGDVELEGIGMLGAGFVLAIGGALTGLALGIVLGLGDSLKALGKILGRGIKGITPKFISTPLANLVKNVQNFFKGISKSFSTRFASIGKTISTAFKPFTNGLKNIQNAFKAGFSGLKTFRTATGQFGKLGFFGNIGKALGNGFRFITSGVKNIRAGFQQISVIFGQITKTFSGVGKGTGGIGKIISQLGNVFKTVFKTFTAIGRTLGRLFLPVSIVLGVIDGVKGFIDGFKNQEGGFLKKLVAGIIGGIGGVIKGLIGIPLDLLKKGVGFIAGLLGFDNFKETLESFSFSALIGTLFDGINNIWQGIIDFFGNLFSDPGATISAAFSSIGDIMGNLVKSILRAILPDPSADYGLFDPRGLAVKAIPDSVYEYAGINPDTGEEVAPPVEAQAPSNVDGEEMDIVSRENAAAATGVTKEEVVNVVGGNSNQQTTNQTIIQNPIKIDKISASNASR